MTVNLSSTEASRLNEILQDSTLLNFDTGDTIARPNEFGAQIMRIRSGEARVLSMSLEGRGPQTLQRLEPGHWIGLSNLLNGEPCEWVSAASQIQIDAIDAETFSHELWKDDELLKEVLAQPHPHLASNAISSWLKSWTSPSRNPDDIIASALKHGRLCSFEEVTDSKDEMLISCNWSAGNPGQLLDHDKKEFINKSYAAPPLAFVIPKDILSSQTDTSEDLSTLVIPINEASKNTERNLPPDAYTLGLRTDSTASLSERYTERVGRKGISSQLAVMEMLASSCNIPFRKDQIRKSLLSFERRGKPFTIPILAKLCTSIGLEARPATIPLTELRKVQPPVLILQNEQPVLIHAIKGRQAILGNGRTKLKIQPLDTLVDKDGKIDFVLVRRPTNSPTDRFNWTWVWSIVKEYRGSLVLVVVISLMAQLFALGTPLLLQQLIDKVLTQGNLSSLNFLAALMIIFALFNSVLTALRMFLFVDTTDRIDLTLGSSVINRLLQLKLSFFEQRPVGELSQRIGEMNVIRNFLTGTAITTFLDLVFSTIYLMVMLSYSPGLTAIALSTFPIYLIITFVSAPVYRQLLRNQAKAAAATQAHLIETLSGIQTVKAQHGELRSRWKWQSRYQQRVEQGYKAMVLGTTTGQIGSFLNTLSSLLILWAGLSMVLNGEFTLGQLLAFRIFAGYVTGPLLRLSNLWQGVQKVNLSMERLGDVVNQPLEAGEFDDEQIPLPPIEGRVKFERLNFGFSTESGLQLNNVDFDVEPGEFIGVVGLSGSGKSTLMKLLARLYPPNQGRILIDDIDIGKVQLSSLRSQVGLVPQDSILFEGSVSENIALNDPNIDSDQIIAAAKLACAHEFIMQMPQGYATRVSEKGANFSGGQRQRLAIARMLLESPSLLIMDEATSALDADTERRVSRNLMEAMNGKTVFFVTHRLATVMRADRIVVMEQGCVAEIGTPSELIEKGGIFAALWNQQS